MATNEMLGTLAATYGPKLAKVLARRAASVKGSSDWVFGGKWTDDAWSGNDRLITTPADDPIRLYNTKTGQSLIVPCPRFISDYGTIPAAISRLAAKYGLRLGSKDFPGAYILHDALYHAHKVYRVAADGSRSVCGISREQADSLLAVALMSRGSAADGDGCATRAEALLVAEAVAIGGRFIWAKGPKADPFAAQGWDSEPSAEPPTYGSVPSGLSLDDLIAQAAALGEAMKAIKDVAADLPIPLPSIVGNKVTRTPKKCIHASCWDGANAKKRMMNMLSPKFSNSKFAEYRDWMKARGCDTAHLFVLNKADGEGGGYSIYGTGGKGAVNNDTVKLFKTRIEDLRKHGFRIVLWLLADDSKDWAEAALKNADGYAADLKASGLLALADMAVLGLEMNEYGTSSGWKALAKALRKVEPDLYLATHHTSGTYTYASLGSGVMGQLDKDCTTQQIASMVATIQKKGKDAWGFELARNPDRKRAQAALDAGAVGVGNW